MSENFQSTPFFRTESTLQPSLPVLNNSTPSGMVCNYSSVSIPAVSSAWLLPSASSTSLQPLMGSAYLNLHASTTMLTVMTDQSHVSNSILCCPVVELETSLGVCPSGQTFCLLQSPEFYITSTQVSLKKTPSLGGDRPLKIPVHSPSESLSLPPAPSYEQTEIKNMHEMPLMPRDAY
uniref:uncharacterized protein C2orf78 homolog n=1 Tax=Arvicanthis niloticus TaxID=61156 RepID=UPI0014861732|nr:uncharacterized protein C2orf78 homolog [Arvicanthis niloticus]